MPLKPKHIRQEGISKLFKLIKLNSTTNKLRRAHEIIVEHVQKRQVS